MVQLHLNDVFFESLGYLQNKTCTSSFTLYFLIFFLFSDASVAGLGFKITINLSQYRKTPFQ